MIESNECNLNKTMVESGNDLGRLTKAKNTLRMINVMHKYVVDFIKISLLPLEEPVEQNKISE